MDSHLIVAGHISQAPNDKKELEPMLKKVSGELDLVTCAYNLKRMHTLVS